MIKKIVAIIVISLSLFISVTSAQSYEDRDNGFSLTLPDSWIVTKPNPTGAFFSDKEDQTKIFALVLPKFPSGRSGTDSFLILKIINEGFVKKMSGAVLETKVDKIANQVAVETIFSYYDKNGNVAKTMVASFWVNDSVIQIGCLSKQTGNLDEVISLFRPVLQSLKLQALTAHEWAEKGHGFRKNKDYDQSIEAFTNAAKLDSKNAEYFYQLAYTNSEKGNLNQAITEITKAIALKPKEAFYYHERAYANYRLKNAAMVLEDDTKAIELDPKKAIFYAGRGNAYALQGKYTEAIADFKKCLELKGGPLDSKFNLGQAYEMAGKQEEALTYYKMIVESPQLPEPVKAKVQARVNGDWQSHKEWL